MLGPFNIEDVVDPIGIRISDAIMNFQRSGFDVTQKVYEKCGNPRLEKRDVRRVFRIPGENRAHLKNPYN